MGQPRARHITPLARRIWQIIWLAKVEQHLCPTYRELVQILGVSSTSVIGHHLRVLTAIGVAHRERGIPRSITVAPYSWVE